LLGFGRSSRFKFSEDPKEAEAQFVDSIEAWRIRMKLEKIILLGHSFGGYLSFLYALKYPHNLSGLILAEPWGFDDYQNAKTLPQIRHLIETNLRNMKCKLTAVQTNSMFLKDSWLKVNYWIYSGYLRRTR
jgi:pimeloyl-ACP methyl ester carboxylesterase